jgi:hypothetical protein
VSQEWQAVEDCVDELVDAILERYPQRARVALVRALEDQLYAEVARAAQAADEQLAAPAFGVAFQAWPPQ